MADFKKLKVWQKAHALSLQVDRDCRQIRSVHYASLRSQMFRAAMSIPANIAEGRRQTSDKQFGRFLSYALNSASELEHHLIVARDTKNIPESDFVPLISQTITVRKMLYGLLRRLTIADSDSTAKKGTSPKAPKESARPKKSGGRQESTGPQDSASR
jgi:four helix bundle protein